MTKKLRFLSRSKGPVNILLEEAILEYKTGPVAGAKRNIYMFMDENRGLPVEPTDKRKVFVVGDTTAGWHHLLPGTAVTYDTYNGTISYSTDETRYIIRAIQDSDVLR